MDFIAANPDWVCPTSYGYVPDCGSVCEMLFRATGRRPVFIGKPQPEMALDAAGHPAADGLRRGTLRASELAAIKLPLFSKEKSGTFL